MNFRLCRVFLPKSRFADRSAHVPGDSHYNLGDLSLANNLSNSIEGMFAGENCLQGMRQQTQLI
jgi:hypothetical protein